MKKNIKIFTVAVFSITSLIAGETFSQNAMPEKMQMQDKGMKMKGDKMKMKMEMADLKSWPMASQNAVKEQMEKYGQPAEMTPTMVVWYNNGFFAKTIITKMESQHNFPKMHTDLMEQSVMYKVPLDMYDELAHFDGSITVDRTQGLLAARCDKEENNLLALNLAHDIITGKKTVEEARQSYGEMVSQAMKGNKPEYMKKLMFTPVKSSADADMETLKM
ncbi:MAG: hypothetical protein WKF35_01175 [Ferruginibacter sp.]